MSETDRGVDRRTPPAPSGPIPLRPTRRRVLAAGAGAAALLGVAGRARAATAAEPTRPVAVAAAPAPAPAGLAPNARNRFPHAHPGGTPRPRRVWRAR
ncbi:hypothetical protein ACFVZN_37140, partial [Streptomyces virginiae]